MTIVAHWTDPSERPPRPEPLKRGTPVLITNLDPPVMAIVEGETADEYGRWVHVLINGERLAVHISNVVVKGEA